MRTTLATLGLLATGLPALAGTLVLVDETSGQTTRRVTYWSDEGVMCRFDDTGLMLSEEGVFTIASHATKTVHRTPLASEPGDDAEAGDVTITPGPTERVGDWSARRYDIEAPLGDGARVEMRLWLSTDVGVDDDIYRDTLRSTALATGQTWLAAVAELEGFPVRQTTSIPIAGQVMTSESVTVSIDEADRPGECAVPAGYESGG